MARNDRSRAKGRRDMGLGDLIRLIAAGFAIAAVVGEFKKPKSERTWHGTVAGFVPYDFRPPTVERALDRVWNPDGPLISPHFMGVGWIVNLGAVVARVRALRTGA